MKMIPAHAPPHNMHELIKALATLLKGKERAKVKDIFENRVKTILQTDKYLTVSSGRRALYIGLKSLGIDKGDEVILPAFTTNIVPMVVRKVGAIPIPADANLHDYNINIETVLERISNRTKAILTVHTFGYPSDLKALKELCEDHHLFLIEDAAPAFGAKYYGKFVGTFGDFGIISFGIGKSISMGGGGGIIASNDELFEKLKKDINIIRSKNSIKIFVKILGSIVLSNPCLYGLFGYRVKDIIELHEYDDYEEEIKDESDISKLAYAIGIQEIKSGSIERRRKIANNYTEILNTFNNVYPLSEMKDIYSAYIRYFVRLNSENKRNKICERMKSLKIEPTLLGHGYPISSNLYPPRFQDKISNSKMLSKTLIGIPIHTQIPDDKLKVIFNRV